MPDLPLIGVGASAGGVEALIELVSGLEAGLPAAVLVVLHQSAASPTVLPSILARHCPLDVVPARDGDDLLPGRVHVAGPGRHLQAANGRVLLTRGPQENGHRPGVDPMFRSLALHSGPRATGVVLSGLLDDGAAGLLDIVRHGGAAVVQDPDEALYDGMPRAALGQVPGAIVRPVRAIGEVLREISGRVPMGEHRPSPQLRYEVAASRGADPVTARQDPPGPPAGLSCPDCDGPLFAWGSPEEHRHRCRVGHAWSPGSLAVAQDDSVERALFVALRALEDKASLQHRVAESAQRSGADRVASHARNTMQGALGDAAVLRRLLADGPGHTDTSGTSGDE